MRVPCVVIAYVGAVPVQAFCRAHTTKMIHTGDSTYFTGAERTDIEPQLIWWIYPGEEEIDLSLLRRNAKVSVELGEAYRISLIHPPNRETLTTECTRLPVEETAGLPLPT